MKRFARKLVPIAFIFALWEVSSFLVRSADVRLARLKLPAPHQLATGIVQEAPGIGSALWVTAHGAILGLACGAIVGLLVALIMAQSIWLERTLYPYVVAGQMVPTIALAPILFTMLQNPLGTRVLVATYITFFAVSLSTLKGLKSVDPADVELLATYSATRRQIFRKLVIPSSMPYFFAGLKVAAPLSVVGQITVELTGATEGLGFILLTAQYYGTHFADLFWGALVGSLALGYAFSKLAVYAERFLTGWQHEFRT